MVKSISPKAKRGAPGLRTCAPNVNQGGGEKIEEGPVIRPETDLAQAQGFGVCP